MAKPTQLHPLKKWRLSRGLTLIAAGQLVGTTRQSWFEWETGRRLPSPGFMPKVCSVAGLSPNDFYDLPKIAAPSDAREAA